MELNVIRDLGKTIKDDPKELDGIDMYVRSLLLLFWASFRSVIVSWLNMKFKEYFLSTKWLDLGKTKEV